MEAPDAPDDMRVTRVAGTGVAVHGDDIDTDQIIPARFLKSTTWEGLDEYAFYDNRRDDDSEITGEHPFDRPEHQGATILVVNENFGCGSSREHAPRALRRWGIEAIVGESFAEIFADNCKSLGMAAAEADPETVAELQSFVEDHPDAGLEVDVAEERVVYDGQEVDVQIDEAMREALVQGVWDTTTLMRDALDQTREVARDLPYVEEVE
jgi:3-isopropylmalate/(R)-2-methylmalate dehydratase small subunit